MSDSPELRTLQALLAIHTRWSKTQDRTAATAPARAGFMKRFEDQVDPERRLDPAERARRAEHAKKAHFSRLALKSAQVRAARKAAREQA